MFAPWPETLLQTFTDYTSAFIVCQRFCKEVEDWKNFLSKYSKGTVLGIKYEEFRRYPVQRLLSMGRGWQIPFDRTKKLLQAFSAWETSSMFRTILFNRTFLAWQVWSSLGSTSWCSSASWMIHSMPLPSTSEVDRLESSVSTSSPSTMESFGRWSENLFET